MGEQCVVVTGGSSGIGRACVEAVAASGVKVVSLDRKPLADLPGVTFHEIDLCDHGSIQGVFANIAAAFEIVGLVNNAGMSLSKSLSETEPEDFAKVVPLNLVAPAICAKFAVESMKRAGWGRIVNISSRVILGKELRTAYAGTKGGIAAMTKVWALELAEHGITVNTVAPGPIATELFKEVNPADSPKTQKIIEGVPVKRLGEPEDIANAVTFFLKKDSGFVTGQTLFVCGGMSVGCVE
ncbi:MAG: short-chain dehydrogenase [Rhodospirillales bacterium CG15_BIG_FIL_POST_REV_8_21_14_020_66_15]|nr:MAG: short-chain dehydrogenase [Rhodospirillales bacterium CG15_BIG_FIL_POST_REV_8_21_14_020_66_15]